MKINIICLGKIKEKYLQDGISEYSKRLSKYVDLNIIELPDEPIPDNPSQKEIDKIKKIESEKIKSKISKNDFVCALDIKGTEMSSLELAEQITAIAVSGFGGISFIIGGSLGLDKDFLKSCRLRISFSKLTFPHQLFRLMLCEQIYRAFKIINNETYHK